MFLIKLQVTLVEFGVYHTPGTGDYKALPGHPAYTDPSTLVSAMRKTIGAEKFSGDPAKAARGLRNIAQISDPPLRIALGKDVIGMINEKVKELTEEVEKYGHFSDDLTFD